MCVRVCVSVHSVPLANCAFESHHEWEKSLWGLGVVKGKNLGYRTTLAAGLGLISNV